ncbi:MAG: beta-galactosidase, partial [Myxococcales bacterium]|nr:beta-galactosidase [Myxococcales bacterium]
MLPLIALAAAAQPPECPFGVNAHQASDTALEKAAAAGIGWVRLEFHWSQIEPSEDLMDWTETDRLVAGADAQGLNIYATVGSTPAWAASTACDDGS